MPVRRSIGVLLGHGWGGGSSAARVSAWLPKRTRIELIADSSATSCIFHWRPRRETQGGSGGATDHSERMFVCQGGRRPYMCCPFGYVSAPPALHATSPSMGRSSTTTDLYQPLRRFAPPPHQWGGAALLQICISTSVGLRPTPPHKWGGTAHRKEGPGLHRTPARKRLTKRLKRSVLLLLRGLLGGLLGRLLGSLLLSHHAITSFSQRYGPDRFHRFGGFHVVVSRGQDSLLHVPPLQPHGRSEERRVGKECRSRWSPY